MSSWSLLFIHVIRMLFLFRVFVFVELLWNLFTNAMDVNLNIVISEHAIFVKRLGVEIVKVSWFVKYAKFMHVMNVVLHRLVCLLYYWVLVIYCRRIVVWLSKLWCNQCLSMYWTPPPRRWSSVGNVMIDLKAWLAVDYVFIYKFA